MKKVYFACSIRGGGDKSVYPELVNAIRTKAELLTEIFVTEGLQLEGGALPEAEIYERDIAWIKASDAVVAEVSNPSLGVGYEIAKAEEWGKPILALYHPGPNRKLSAMIAGSPNLQLQEYTDISGAKIAIEKFLVD